VSVLLNISVKFDSYIKVPSSSVSPGGCVPSLTTCLSSLVSPVSSGI
jgi:hypothetical protein